MNSSPILKSFSRRVRLVRAWVGLSIGLSVGALLAVVWAGLDWANILYAEWSSLGWLVGTCGLIGLLVGAFRSVSATALADSIDRRARLENRLSTAAERSSTSGAFDDALRQDATDHLKGLKPAKLYPIRLGKWHAGAALFSILAASIFLLGNTPLLLGKDAKATRAKMQEQAAKIDHVLKPMEEEAKKGELNPAEKKLAEDLKKLSQDLKKARIDPEKALQRQNELNKEAQKLQDERFQKADQSMQTAQQAFDKMQKEKLEQRMDMDPKGMTGAEMEQAKLDLSKMSPQDLGNRSAWSMSSIRFHLTSRRQRCQFRNPRLTIRGMQLATCWNQRRRSSTKPGLVRRLRFFRALHSPRSRTSRLRPT